MTCPPSVPVRRGWMVGVEDAANFPIAAAVVAVVARGEVALLLSVLCSAWVHDVPVHTGGIFALGVFNVYFFPSSSTRLSVICQLGLLKGPAF